MQPLRWKPEERTGREPRPFLEEQDEGLLFQGEDREIELREGEIVLGRSSECGVLLDSETVSRKHARVSIREGSVFIEDLGSRNGTFVNGKQVVEKVQIKPGDAVQFGDVRFELFQTPPEEARTVVMSQEAVPQLSTEQAPRPIPPSPSEPPVHRVPQPPPPQAAPSPPMSPGPSRLRRCIRRRASRGSPRSASARWPRSSTGLWRSGSSS